MQGRAQKTPEKAAQFQTSHLDWFFSNGIDLRLMFSSAMRHEKDAGVYERVLRRRSLSSSLKEMDGYLRECRLAGAGFFDIARRLEEAKAKFLSDPANANFSSERYDSIVDGLRKKASAIQKNSWAYEKEYAKRHGPREEYRVHLLVRDVARQLREEMERNAGRTPSPVYSRSPERPAFAQNARPEPPSRETRELISSVMREIREKYEGRAAQGEARIARAEPQGGYRRGYERAGKKYVETGDEEASRYHRGERKALRPPARIPVEEPVKAARLDLAKPRLRTAQAKVDRIKKERDELRKGIASLSGAEKKRASEELLQLNRTLFKAREERNRIRESLA